MSKVDILIPSLNSSKTIIKTLQSIKNQSFNDYRVVLVDNFSNDNTVDLFKSIMTGFNSEIRMHTLRVSAGENFNRCLNYVESEFFCIMHSDDEYTHDYLKEMLLIFNKFSDVEVAFCKAFIIDKSSNKIFSFKNFIKCLSLNNLKNPIHGFNGLIWNSSFDKIIAPTMFFKSSVIKNYGVFDTSYAGVLDWEYIFRLLKNGCKFYYINKYLFKYRLHNNQQTYHQTHSLIKYNEQIHLIDVMSDYLKINYCYQKKFNYFYLYLAIINDIFLDIIFLRINFLKSKTKFLISKLFNFI